MEVAYKFYIKYPLNFYRLRKLSTKVDKLTNGIRFYIRVIPKSSKNILCVTKEGLIKLKINAPPIDGKANEACIKLIAESLGISKANVRIVSGLKSRNKVVEISGNSDTLYSSLINSLDQD